MRFNQVYHNTILVVSRERSFWAGDEKGGDLNALLLAGAVMIHHLH